MNKRVAIIALSIFLFLLLIILYLFGLGIHTRTELPKFNLEKRIVEQESSRFIGLRRGWGMFIEFHSYEISLIPLGSIKKIMPAYCEIKSNGADNYEIICRERKEWSSPFIVMEYKTYTREELNSYGYYSLPENYSSPYIPVIPEV